MCTLTYLPEGDDMALVSSRDETRSRGGMRPIALDPLLSAYYPLDEHGKGTWFYVAPSRYTLVVLNGGHVPHERVLPYRHSRGLVPFHFATFPNADTFTAGYDFHDLEPFTLVVIEEAPRVVRSIVWTGERADHVLHAPHRPRVWSSTTLYDAAARGRRESWFHAALNAPFGGNAVDRLLQFHRDGGSSWPDQGERILMQRGEDLGTVCHVGLERRTGNTRLYFHDLAKTEEQWTAMTN